MNVGQYNKALGYYNKSLLMQQQMYGEDLAHPDTSATLNNNGSFKRKLGQYSEALGYYNKSLLMQQQLYGEDVAHPDTADTLNNIGN